MTGKTPLVLGSVLIGLLALATILSSLYPTASEERQVAQRVFPELRNISVDDVTEITLVKDGQTLRFQYDKQNDRWVLVEPVNVLADRTAVRNIAFDIKQLTKKSIPGEEEGAQLKATKEKLVEFGLDQPKRKVTLAYIDDGDKHEVTLLVGSQTADEEGWYVMVEGKDEVFVVSKYSISSIDKELVDFKQKRLIATNRWDAVAFALERSGERMLAEKEEDEDQWMLVEPVRDKADGDKIRSLIGELYDTSVSEEGFVDEDLTEDELAKYGLDKPQLVVRVGRTVSGGDEDEEEKERKVFEDVAFGKTFEEKQEGKTQKKVYARLCGMNYVVAVNAGVLDRLNVSANDLRSHDVVDLAVTDVDYIEIVQGDSKIVLAKPDFDWKIYEPVEIEAHRESVEQLIQTLDDMRIREFLDNAKLADYSLEKPTVVIRAYKNGLEEEGDEEKKAGEKPKPKGTPVVVAIGKYDKEKGLVYVRRGEESTVLAVAADSVWERVRQSYLAYRTRRVLSFSRPDVVSLAVYRDGQTFRLEKRKVKDGSIETDKWFLVSPVEAPADTTAVDDILWDLSNLDAAKFYAEGDVDLAKYGLDKPAIRCTVTLKSEDEENASSEEDKEKAEEDKDSEKKTQHVLLVGKQVENDTEQYYAKLGDENLVFGLQKRIVDLLTAELRDRTLLKFTVDDVTEMAIAYAQGPTLELEYKEPEGEDLKKWTLKAGASFELDTQRVRDFVQFLSTLKADRYAQYQGDFKKEYELDSPALKVNLRLKDGTSYVLRVGASAGDEKWYATVETENKGLVAIISGTELSNALKGPEHFAKEDQSDQSDQSDQADQSDQPDRSDQSDQGTSQ